MRPAIRFVLLLCTATMLHAQAPVQQPRFALEISEDGFPPHFVNVPEGQQAGGIDSMFFDLHQLPGYGARNSEKRKPSAVELVCKMDGDAVAITASVVFGPFDPTDARVSLEGHPKQEIGTFTSHLNESIVLQEMEQFGLQPWTIRIVNAQMPGPASLPTLNEVPSIQPEILGKDREGYRIALRNLSSRAVTAFLVETTLDHNNSYQQYGDRGVVIAPGANHEFRLFCDTSAPITSNGIAPGPAPCAFNLKAALFADGSYEGDASAAATLAVRSIAAQFQRRRVHELIDNIVADSSLDDTSRLARIRSELPKLSEEPDPAILEQIRLRFPGIPSTAWGSIKADIQNACASEKQMTLRALKDFENLPKQGPSLTQWWSAWAASPAFSSQSGVTPD